MRLPKNSALRQSIEAWGEKAIIKYFGTLDWVEIGKKLRRIKPKR